MGNTAATDTGISSITGGLHLTVDAAGAGCSSTVIHGARANGRIASLAEGVYAAVSACSVGNGTSRQSPRANSGIGALALSDHGTVAGGGIGRGTVNMPAGNTGISVLARSGHRALD